MIALEHQILLAVALDLLLGDPRGLPHPVRMMGWLAARVEKLLRRVIGSNRVSGLMGWTLVVGTTAGISWGILAVAETRHPVARDVAGIVLMYFAVAARDLVDHSQRVYRALEEGNLPEARRRVGMIVGRDTDALDEAGVVRAAVESVAESMVDGVTAPLFFAVVGGPVAALGYRAVNTLDSMWGHREEPYTLFGWVAARLDDVANFIPARLTAWLVSLSATLPGYRAGGAWRALRDGRKHPSPNAGLVEAAVAGALGVQLGGVTFYDKVPHERALLGEAVEPLNRRHIRRANALMWCTSALVLAVMLGCRSAIVVLWER